jgi:hypothetical protein
MVAVVPSGSSRAGNRAAQKKPRVSGAEYFGGTSNLPQMRPVDENVVSTDVWARCVTTITQECAFLQGAELDRAAAHLRDDGRHCPMHVDAAPEARTVLPDPTSAALHRTFLRSLPLAVVHEAVTLHEMQMLLSRLTPAIFIYLGNVVARRCNLSRVFWFH